MRKLLPSLLTLLVLAPNVAFAGGGMNLSWAKCQTTPASGNQNYACDSNFLSPFILTGTFRPDFDMSDFAGTDAVIDIAFASAPPPDFWRFDYHACDASALTMVHPAIAAPCATPNIFDPTHTAGGFAAENPAPNRERIRVDEATGTPTALTAENLYPAFQLWLDGDQGASFCTGCSEPACLVLMSVTVYGYAVNEAYTLTSTDVRNYVTWQGGSIGGAGCPAATPAHNRTWGQIKSIYR